MEDGTQDTFGFFQYYERPAKKTVSGIRTYMKGPRCPPGGMKKKMPATGSGVSRVISSHKSVLGDRRSG
jgi:hypothetical protein